MDPYRGFHRRFLYKRQSLGGALGNLLDSSTSSSVSQGKTTATSQSNGDPLGISGVVNGFTSVVGNVLPSSGLSSTTTSSAPLTHSTSSSTGSTTPSASAMTSSTTSTTSTTSTPTPTPTPTAAPVSDIVYTSSDGTSIVYVTSTLPAASATAAPTTSFLQNPSLEGGVFALVGIVVLAIVFVAITWSIRKRRRDRLERDIAVAVNFDPSTTDRYEREENSVEKRRLSVSSSGHGQAYGYGYGYGVQPAYAPQQEYHGPVGYGQYTTPAYSGPSPDQAPYQTLSPAVPQPAAQGGANLTRKFSDRKPVPPLLPDPAYDPSNAHVSIPPQFYAQQ